MNKVNSWEPKGFKIETSSVWKFPERGNWATHDGNYRGNWSPYVPRNIILRYSNPGDLVLDQFVGGGTTLVEAKLLGRDCIGVDVNEEALNRCKRKCQIQLEKCGQECIKKGDARKLDFISSESIDLICMHPPYADAIKYSEHQENDISLLPVDEFLDSMKMVAEESKRVLKKGKYCTFLIGDIRRKGKVFPLGFKTMEIFQKLGFEIKEIVLKEQFNCKSTSKWYKLSIEKNFLLLAHEYLFIMIK
ncbi:MAG: DNA methyltransferase [Clostridia bacterium]|nr:DNA methyltransferase [Clostridia bacterium]